MINAVKSTTVMKMEGSYDDIMGILHETGYIREILFYFFGKFKHGAAVVVLSKEIAKKVERLSKTFNIKIVE